MKNEDLDFLISLQKELIEQNDRYNLQQAEPIYVGIMDYQWKVVPEDLAEETHVLCFGEAGYKIDDFVHYLSENYKQKNADIPENEIIDNLKDCYTTEDLRTTIDEYFSDIDSSDYELIYVQKAGYIAPNCCFITWSDAVEHLKNNTHHYSIDAHPYAMTAFRSPQLERLLEIVKTTGWRIMKARQKGGKE